ncbi:MAG TPA: GGDEF domain-containing protein [Sandaracinaceae bacterium]
MTDPGDRGRPTVPEGFDVRALFPKANEAGERPVLVVLTGAQVGQRILLEQPALIGRDPECDLMLTDEGVEWHHCRVVPRDEGWTVVDLTGARRTEVNGMRVSELLLSPDDQIILGGTVVRFEVHDPIEQAYDQAVLERLNKDDLTGLLARRKFDVELESAVLAADRRGEPLAVVVLDVDGVKPINDRYGHLVGARVIAEVGGVIGRVVGEQGPCCRLGGDEFGVALPGMDAAAAFELADRVRRAVAATPFEHDGEPLRVRISGGVALLGKDGDTPIALLRAADEALYRAKRAGGDRIERR